MPHQLPKFSKAEGTILRKVVNQCRQALIMRRRLIESNVKPDKVSIFVMLKVDGRKTPNAA